MNLPLLSKVWPYLAGLLIVVLLARGCASNALHDAENKANAALLKQADDSLGKLNAALAADTVPLEHIHDTVTKVVTKIRTLVLTKVDSGLAVADAAIQLVPPSDTACHKAFDALRPACEMLRQQVVADSGLFRAIGDTVQRVKQHDATMAQGLKALGDTLRLVRQAYVCQINLLVAHLGCPSRTVMLLLGAGSGAGAALVLHH